VRESEPLALLCLRPRLAFALASGSHAAPYRHFADKDELLAALADEGFTSLAEAMREAASRGRTPRARLRRAGVAYVELARANSAHFSIMFGPERSRSRAEGPKAFEGLARLVADCQAAGELRPGDPEELARMAWSLVHGIAELCVAGQLDLQDEVSTERFTLRAVDALVAGLAP
jgi:AcrR family transcriptional regulator